MLLLKVELHGTPGLPRAPEEAVKPRVLHVCAELRGVSLLKRKRGRLGGRAGGALHATFRRVLSASVAAWHGVGWCWNLLLSYLELGNLGLFRRVTFLRDEGIQPPLLRRFLGEPEMLLCEARRVLLPGVPLLGPGRGLQPLGNHHDMKNAVLLLVASFLLLRVLLGLGVRMSGWHL